MKILCYDNLELTHFCVFECVCAYYDVDIMGIVFISPCDLIDDFCIPNLDIKICKGIIERLYYNGFCDCTEFGMVELLSDIL